jgi:hypothetical protein
MAYTENLKEEFHYGSFEYCFFSTEPSGYSHRRRYTGNVDDLTGCLSGQTAGKALFSQQKVTTASQFPNSSGRLL